MLFLYKIKSFHNLYCYSYFFRLSFKSNIYFCQHIKNYIIHIILNASHFYSSVFAVIDDQALILFFDINNIRNIFKVNIIALRTNINKKRLNYEKN